MKNKVGEKKNYSKLTLSLVLLTMSVTFAMVLSTVAWFTAKNTADNGVNEIMAVANEISGTNMKAYSVTGIEGDTYTFINNENYILPRFDPSNIDYNAYEKALVLRIEFNSSVEALFQVEVTCTEGWHDDADIQAENLDHLSNCIEFRAGTIDGVVDKNTFESATVTTTTKTSFVEVVNNTVVKSSNTINIIDINAVVGTNVAYVVLQYNDSVIEYINTLRNNNPTPVTYLNDISFKIVGGSNE